MRYEYFDDETEINPIDLLKDIFKNIKKIVIITIVCGLLTFLVSEFIIPKYYTSSADITIIPIEQSSDYTTYLTGDVVLKKVSSKLKIDQSDLAENIVVTRDAYNGNNYNLAATTNDAELSYRVVNQVIKVFETEMLTELNLSSVDIMNAAQINNKPVSPNVKKNTLMGTCAGLIGSIFVIVFCYIFDKFFKNAAEIESYLDLDVLGEISQEKVKNEYEYRKIRINIEYSEKCPNAKSICLVSASQISDTTTIAFELSKIFTINHSNVLIIDCNIESSYIKEHFNTTKQKGLIDILENKDFDKYQNYIDTFSNDDNDNLLSIMCIGKSIKNPIDLLSSKIFEEFMDEMKKQFDFIIIDCPSLEDSMDIIPVSHTVDGTIIVISMKNTEKVLAKRTVEQLRKNNVHLLGTITTNDVLTNK